MLDKPNILIISGFDPSGGAGMLADVKTVENLGGYGMGILTANTTQSERKFNGLEWIHEFDLMSQLDFLLSEYIFQSVKIGIIESPSILKRVLLKIREIHPAIPIVWDPVIKSSTGYSFHNSEESWKECLDLCSVVTPNAFEMEYLAQEAGQISEHCDVLVTGTTSEETVSDLYYSKGRFIEAYSNEKLDNMDKHGTGCMLSSAVATRLAFNDLMKDAFLVAQDYVKKRMLSNTGKLAWHHEVL